MSTLPKQLHRKHSNLSMAVFYLLFMNLLVWWSRWFRWDHSYSRPGPKGKHLAQVLHFLSSFPSKYSSGMHVMLSPSFYWTSLGDIGDDGTDGSPGRPGPKGKKLVQVLHFLSSSPSKHSIIIDAVLSSSFHWTCLYIGVPGINGIEMVYQVQKVRNWPKCSTSFPLPLPSTQLGCMLCFHHPSIGHL